MKYNDIKDLLQISQSTFFNWKKKGILDQKVKEAMQEESRSLSLETQKQAAKIQLSTQQALKDGVVAMMEKMTHIIDHVDFSKIDEHDKINFMISYMREINAFTLASKGIPYGSSPFLSIDSGLKKENQMKLGHKLKKEMIALKEGTKGRKKDARS